jgi:hypothetical protein
MDLKRIDKKRLLDHKAHISSQKELGDHDTYMLKMIEINVNILDLEMQKIALEIDHFNEKISNLSYKK